MVHPVCCEFCASRAPKQQESWPRSDDCCYHTASDGFVQQHSRPCPTGNPPIEPDCNMLYQACDTRLLTLFSFDSLIPERVLEIRNSMVPGQAPLAPAEVSTSGLEPYSEPPYQNPGSNNIS